MIRTRVQESLAIMSPASPRIHALPRPCEHTAQGYIRQRCLSCCHGYAPNDLNACSRQPQTYRPITDGNTHRGGSPDGAATDTYPAACIRPAAHGSKPTDLTDCNGHRGGASDGAATEGLTPQSSTPPLHPPRSILNEWHGSCTCVAHGVREFHLVIVHQGVIDDHDQPLAHPARRLRMRQSRRHAGGPSFVHARACVRSSKS